jgi:uncharacterized integral membrane protein (TIGR00698 family)
VKTARVHATKTAASIRSWARSVAPGLSATFVITAVAYLAASAPGLRVLGALGIALFLGIGARAVLGLPSGLLPGAAFSAKTLLRLGVVLLGVRLNFGLLAEAGGALLFLDVLVVILGIALVEFLGRWMGVPRGLRLSVAIGSGICGASAIAAAAPVVKAKEEEASASVAVVSVLGTLGVLAYVLTAPILGIGTTTYGMLTGSTLHEVGQVLAAGFALGPQAGDLALVTKLTRVALLAPVLVVIGALLHEREDRADGGARSGTEIFSSGVVGVARRVAPPPFLIGFLAVGVFASTGLIGESTAAGLQNASLILTAAAMAGIGLSTDLRALGRIGVEASLLGLAGFVALVLLAVVYLSFVPH